ncbi:MAG: hypothetical protein RBR20_13120, partial [Desulfobacterales bacterium]|nr:hypothetical protein [Desulfobacterales bacterium]
GLEIGRLKIDTGDRLLANCASGRSRQADISDRSEKKPMPNPFSACASPKLVNNNMLIEPEKTVKPNGQ